MLEKKSYKKENVIERKDIIKKILKYSIPFIIISLLYNLYNTIDMILVSRTMSDLLHYPISTVESVVSVFTTWGVKLNNIIIAVITGIITSLIPNIVSSYTKGNKKDVDDKFNKALQCVLFIMVPATLFLSFLAKPVWTLFYGNSFFGPEVYRVYVFSALFGGFYSIVVNTLQGINKYKLVIITVFIGLILNTVLDVPLMLLMDNLGYQVSHGAVYAAIIGYSTSVIISLIVLHKKYQFKFTDTRKRLPKYVISWLIFEITIVLLKLIIPTNLSGRLIQIPILLGFGLVSFGIYILINYKNGNLNNLIEMRKKNENRNSK